MNSSAATRLPLSRGELQWWPGVGFTTLGLIPVRRVRRELKDHDVQKFPMTAPGLQRLEDELRQLKAHERPTIIRAIAEARAHGDLSENAEYHAAKARQGMVNARLNQLKQRLAEMSMIDFSKIPHDRVGLGSIVVVLDSKTDAEVTYNLVTVEEADAANGKISTTSPIGRALLGKEVGDVARVQSPNGTKDLEILKLTTIHDVVE